MATLAKTDKLVESWLARDYVRRTKLDSHGEDGPTWHAWLPQFGIYAARGMGQTEAEALEELEAVLRASFRAMAEQGNEPPAPLPAAQLDLDSDDDEANDLPSGNLRIRMPRELHAELIRGAERNGCSLNTYMVHLLSSRSAVQEAQSPATMTWSPEMSATHFESLAKRVMVRYWKAIQTTAAERGGRYVLRTELDPADEPEQQAEVVPLRAMVG